MPSLELSLGEEDDASAQASSSSTTTTPRRRTLINFRMKRIALGVRKIFSKQDSSSALVPNTGSSSGLPPLSPSHRNLTNKFRLQRTKSNAALTTERDIFPPISEMWTNKTFVDLPCAKGTLLRFPVSWTNSPPRTQTSRGW